MNNDKVKHRGAPFYLNIYGVLILVVVLLLTVGYASFGDNMSISGAVATVIPEVNIKITSVTAVGNNGATVGTTEHGYKYISSSVTMPQNSTVTYTVTVTNLGNEPMAIYAINPTFSPNDIKIVSTSGYNIGDKICSSSNPSQCTLNAVRTFTITIGYNSYGGTQNHEVNLDFEFIRTFDITYSHITNNGYPAVAYEGKPFQVTFTGDVPSELIISPTHTHTYQNGTLTIPNVTNDITINRYYSITYNLNGGTQANNQVTKYLYGDNLTILNPTRSNYAFLGWYENSSFQGNAITSTNGLNRNLNLYAKWGEIYSVTYVDIADSGNYPSTVVSGNTYNQTFATAPSSVGVTMGGNTLTSGTDFTYSNGTLTIPNVSGNIVITGVTGGGGTVTDTTTTTYDPDNVPANTTITYEAISGAPRVSTDSSGNITSFEYTNASSTNPVTVTNTVDTGFIPFDGSSNWELNMHFRYASEDNSLTTGNNVVSIISCVDWKKNGNSNYLASGFALRFNALKNVSTNMYNNMLKYRVDVQVSVNDASSTKYLYNTNSSGVVVNSPMVYTLVVRKSGNTMTLTISNDTTLQYSKTSSSTSNLTTSNAGETHSSTWSDNNSSSNVDIIIGGYLSSSGSITQKANIDVYSFEVHKIS